MVEVENMEEIYNRLSNLELEVGKIKDLVEKEEDLTDIAKRHLMESRGRDDDEMINLDDI